MADWIAKRQKQVADDNSTTDDKRARILELLSGLSDLELAQLLGTLPPSAKYEAVVDWFIKCPDEQLIDQTWRSLAQIAGPA